MDHTPSCANAKKKKVHFCNCVIPSLQNNRKKERKGRVIASGKKNWIARIYGKATSFSLCIFSNLLNCGHKVLIINNEIKII